MADTVGNRAEDKVPSFLHAGNHPDWETNEGGQNKEMHPKSRALLSTKGNKWRETSERHIQKAGHHSL